MNFGDRLKSIFTNVAEVGSNAVKAISKNQSKATKFMDKYSVMKKLLIIGIFANLYFCYQSWKWNLQL